MDAFLLDCRKAGVSARQARFQTRSKFAPDGDSHNCPAPTLRDIYSSWARIRSVALTDTTLIRLVMAKLEKENLWYRSKSAPDRSLGVLLFEHPELLAIWKVNSDLLIVDCTYEVVRYGIPLMAVVFKTRTGVGPPSLHIFMPSEIYEGYLWAFTQIKNCMDGNQIDALGLLP